MVLKLTFIEDSPEVQKCAKCFPYMISFNPQKGCHEVTIIISISVLHVRRPRLREFT